MTDREKAEALIKAGQACVLDDDYETALLHFKHSVDTFPTAEGYTYWAWMLSYQGELETCITLCKKAIEIDPEFGNAYNDIGSYLIELDQLDAAIPWLIKATEARHTDAPHFPYINLARIYLKQNKDALAIEAYTTLLELDPSNVEARYVLAHLRESDNGGLYWALFSSN